ncbi:MAG TPA: hypothetical protein VJS44_12060 [Pyrinomonadaceae bacterium]|nr:hypothetical protein [Pyrinomonadaceae bacterium]
MNTKEVAAHYEAKVFDSKEAATAAGFELADTLTTRNTWNKASAAQAIIHKLLQKKRQGETDQIGLVIEPQSITGVYKKSEGRVQNDE